MTEGVAFGLYSVSRLLDRYAAQAGGPPFIEEVEPGVYRAKVDQQHRSGICDESAP